MNRRIFFRWTKVIIFLFSLIIILSACQSKKEKTNESTSKKTIETTIETKSNEATIIVEDSSN
ncbi:hypothetical protein [Candidatus Enterococcus mansonii]|uniref:Uncharacterized protein n=1 Tax=Candidatus Enterococcus mansonii TaxID=1834181 RepID=A0A242C823_9ENTE|nr:hypothetical protein A5880_003117 [Enterococcus sp. 4G2_DIV0659]